MKKLNKRGFTIVELSIVVAVIAILSAVLVPTFTGMVKKSKNTATIQDAQAAYTQYITTAIDKGDEYEANAIYEVEVNNTTKYIALKAGKAILETNSDSVKYYDGKLEAAQELDADITGDNLDTYVKAVVGMDNFYSVADAPTVVANN